MATRTVYESGLDRFNRPSKGVNLLLHLLFFFLAVICVVPMLVVLSISLSSEDSIRENGYHLIPTAFSGMPTGISRSRER